MVQSSGPKFCQATPSAVPKTTFRLFMKLKHFLIVWRPYSLFKGKVSRVLILMILQENESNVEKNIALPLNEGTIKMFKAFSSLHQEDCCKIRSRLVDKSVSGHLSLHTMRSCSQKPRRKRLQYMMMPVWNPSIRETEMGGQRNLRTG